jgi:hypothetical protein
VSGGDEYVVIENADSQTVNFDGWTLSDAADQTYTFGDISVGSGETVVVTTNETPSDGAPSAEFSINWDAGFVWNNAGDTATLRDASGAVVDTYSY